MSTSKNKVKKLSDFFDVKPVVERMSIAVGAGDFAKFADFLGVSLQTVYNYASGRRDLGWEVVLKVSQHSGRSIEWLLYGTPPPQKVVGKIDRVDAVFRNIEGWVRSLEKPEQRATAILDLLEREYRDFVEWQKKQQEAEQCGTAAAKEGNGE